MVTGDLFVDKIVSDPSYEPKNSSLYQLFAHWNRKTLRLLVFDPNAKKVVASGAFVNSANLELGKFFETLVTSHSELKQEFKSVFLSCSGYKSTLIPLKIYDFRKKNVLLNTENEIRESRHSKIGAVLISEISALESTVLKIYPNCKTYSNGSLLLERLISKFQFEKVDRLFIEICGDRVELYAFKKGKFRLFNGFDWNHNNDILFHALNTAQQCDLSAQETELHICGDHANDENLLSLVSNYFKTISSGEDFTKVVMSEALHEVPKSEFLSVLNLLTCV